MILFFILNLLWSFSFDSPAARLFLVESGWTANHRLYTIYADINGTLNAGQTLSFEFMAGDSVYTRHMTKTTTTSTTQLTMELQLPTKVGEPDRVLVRVDTVSIPVRTMMAGRHAKNDSLQLSGLLTYIKRTIANQTTVFPANNFFSESDTLLYRFSTSFIKKQDFDRVIYRLTILSANGDTVVSYFRPIQSETLQSHAGYLALESIPTGKYNYRVSLYKNNQPLLSAQSNDFFVINPILQVPVAKDQAGNSQGLFNHYTNDELDEMFTMSSYLATMQEQELYPQLKSVVEKRQFLESFWSRRAADPIYPLPLSEYMDQVRLVQKLYGIPKKPGYLTDRGRVMLQYGACDDLYESSLEVDTKPYEVWYYQNLSGQGSVYFYFVDVNGFGDFRLIHSTARDEVYNLSYLLRLGIDPDEYRQ